MPRHSHYFKSVEHLSKLDVYRVLSLYGVVDPCVQHAIKKLLVTGNRAGGKTAAQDVQDAIDSLRRWQDMQAEDFGGMVEKLAPEPAPALPPDPKVLALGGAELALPCTEPKELGRFLREAAEQYPGTASLGAVLLAWDAPLPAPSAAQAPANGPR